MHSVQFSRSVVSDSLPPQEPQHARPPCPRSLPKPMSIELLMPSNHLILCRPFFLLPSIFPSIRIFSLCIRWPKYWSFSFGISPSNEYSGWICFFIFHTGMFKLRDTCGICWRLHCPVVILKNAIQVLALNVLAFYPPTSSSIIPFSSCPQSFPA